MTKQLTFNVAAALPDGRVVDIEVTRKRVRRFNLRVDLAGRASATVPPLASEADARRFIASRAGWLQKALERQSRAALNRARADDVRDGGHIRLFGRELPMAFRASKKRSARLCADALEVCGPDGGAEALQKTVERWRAETAREYLAGITRELLPRFAKYGVTMPAISIKRMKTRWGSCSPAKRRVNYNVRLLSAPAECARYVAAHELAHFVVPAHDKRFYAVLAEVVPDWRELRERLKLEQL